MDADLSFQYQNLLHQEEDFWALKSRLQWANFGDRNTTFFHISTIGKWHHNKILCLKNQNGEWSNSPAEMKQIVQSHFVGLYTTGFESSARAIPWPEVHNTFPQDFCSTLMQEVSPAEIKNAIMSFKPFKSPGPNGLYPVFFQKFWDTLGPSVIHFIKNIFRSRKIPGDLNSTLVNLIPKVTKPESVTQFRPIGFCNTLFKTTTKILVLRLKPFLNDLVHPFQASFIPGRKASDNVIIV